MTKITYLDEKDRPSFPYIMDFKEWVKENYTLVDIDHLNEYRIKYDEYLDSFDEVKYEFQRPINLFASISNIEIGIKNKDLRNYDEIIVLGQINRIEPSINVDSKSYYFAVKNNGRIERIYIGYLNNGTIEKR